jgi:hypothetical protein
MRFRFIDLFIILYYSILINFKFFRENKTLFDLCLSK